MPYGPGTYGPMQGTLGQLGSMNLARRRQFGDEMPQLGPGGTMGAAPMPPAAPPVLGGGYNPGGGMMAPQPQPGPWTGGMMRDYIPPSERGNPFPQMPDYSGGLQRFRRFRRF